MCSEIGSLRKRTKTYSLHHCYSAATLKSSAHYSFVFFVFSKFSFVIFVMHREKISVCLDSPVYYIHIGLESIPPSPWQWCYFCNCEAGFYYQRFLTRNAKRHRAVRHTMGLCHCSPNPTHLLGNSDIDINTHITNKAQNIILNNT